MLLFHRNCFKENLFKSEFLKIPRIINNVDALQLGCYSCRTACKFVLLNLFVYCKYLLLMIKLIIHF